MSILQRAAILAIAFGASASAYAMFENYIENKQAEAKHFFTGNDLVVLPKDSVLTYVAGVVDRDLAIGDVPEAGNPYCLPPSVITTQTRDVVVKYLADNPAERHKSGAFLVRAALRKAFPCR